LKLPDFRNHEDLNELRELMGAELRHEKGNDTKLDRSIKPLTIENFSVEPDGVFKHRRQKVLLYIQNWKTEKDNKKYHIVNCKWIQKMQRENKNWYSLYVNGKPENGKLPVKLPGQSEPVLLNLNVCQYCLEKLELRYKLESRYYSRNKKIVLVYQPDKFPLSDWFDAIDDGYEPLLIDRIKSKNSYYIVAWKFLSWVCRKNAHWKCQECGIEFGHERSDRRFLHAHHIKGTRHNHPENLRALCIGCHAEQPGEGHQRLKKYTEYQEFMTKYGEKWKLATN
jgi:hypothetical protein